MFKSYEAGIIVILKSCKDEKNFFFSVILTGTAS